MIQEASGGRMGESVWPGWSDGGLVHKVGVHGIG